MKKKDKLLITKNNYEGYVELYKSKKNMYDDESLYLLIWMAKLFLIAGFGLLVLAVTTLIAAFVSVSQVIIILELLALAGAEIVVMSNGIKNIFNKRKNILNAVKQKYPYVDTKMDDRELKESLIESKIITYENDTTEIFRVKEYQNFLKVEEIKEKYFEETKYNSYIINPEIQPQELEKPKVKKLVR